MRCCRSPPPATASVSSTLPSAPPRHLSSLAAPSHLTASHAFLIADAQDHYREDDPSLKQFTLKEFTKLVFEQCPGMESYRVGRPLSPLPPYEYPLPPRTHTLIRFTFLCSSSESEPPPPAAAPHGRDLQELPGLQGHGAMHGSHSPRSHHELRPPRQGLQEQRGLGVPSREDQQGKASLKAVRGFSAMPGKTAESLLSPPSILLDRTRQTRLVPSVS